MGVVCVWREEWKWEREGSEKEKEDVVSVWMETVCKAQWRSKET